MSKELYYYVVYHGELYWYTPEAYRQYLRALADDMEVGPEYYGCRVRSLGSVVDVTGITTDRARAVLAVVE